MKPIVFCNEVDHQTVTKWRWVCDDGIKLWITSRWYSIHEIHEEHTPVQRIAITEKEVKV